MAEYTDNLNLKKPASTEYFNIEDFNSNAQKVDVNALNKMTFKGILELLSDLPIADQKVGDFYFITEVTSFYLWNGTGWSYQVNENTDFNNVELTGIPLAPTATNGTNTTQIATTAFVQAAIALLVSSSPAALDTLNELATALGNDPNFATTITNILSEKSELSVALSKTLATASWVADGVYWKYAIPITEVEAGIISSDTNIELIPLERSTFGTAALFKTYLDLIQNANIQGESITATSSGTGYVNIIAMGTKPTSDVTIIVNVRGD